jgi:hypothetical protein
MFWRRLLLDEDDVFWMTASGGGVAEPDLSAGTATMALSVRDAATMILSIRDGATMTLAIRDTATMTLTIGDA